MLEEHQLISHLLCEFPQFRSRWDEDPERSGVARPYLDMSRFVRFLTDELYEKEDYKQVHSAFERMEQFLRDGTAGVRELVVVGFLETLRNVASWKPYGGDVFVRFLRPESNRFWTKLDAVGNLNLEDCSVLEAEVLIWRIVRHSLSHSTTIPASTSE
jgi:hypothetical protein